MTKRLSYIDSLKGFTMLLVILGHIADGYLTGGLYSTREQAVFLTWLYDLIYAFHMPLFIMISGFLYGMIYISKPDGTARLKRQTGNLAILYAVYSIFLILVKFLLAGHVNQPLMLTDIALLWGKTVNPYWYLYVLILFYFTFAIPPIRKASPRILLPLFAGLCAISGWVQTSWFELHNYFFLLLFFYLGILLCQKRLPILEHPGFIFPVFGLSLVLEFVFSRHPSHYPEIPVAGGIIAFGYVLMFWYLFRKIRLLSNARFLVFLGACSLELYLLHCYFTAGFRVLFASAGTIPFAVCLIVTMILSTLLPLLFTILTKKLGIHDLFFHPVSFFGRIIRSK